MRNTVSYVSCARAGAAGLTFVVDLLADTTYAPVLDRSVTTVDVEEGVAEEPAAGQKGDSAGEGKGGACWGLATGETTSPLLGHGLQPLHVLLHGIPVRHGGRWWAAFLRCRATKAWRMGVDVGEWRLDCVSGCGCWTTICISN